jgi:hypothetical protein
VGEETKVRWMALALHPSKVLKESKIKKYVEEENKKKEKE